MIGIFGLAGSFVVLVLTIGLARAMRAFANTSVALAPYAAERPARVGGHSVIWLRDALTLRHLHATGADCTRGIETRTPWRRYFHHCTFYGFALCLASTTVAAIYHTFFGWFAPYAYASVPVALGTTGGIGLLVGPAGLLCQRRLRDGALEDPAQRGLDVSFIVMLLATSLTGLLLLVCRATTFMSVVLVVHLGFVLGLFLTMPYGKFVHGLYRTVALLKFSRERTR
jgi:citrate/tricarballylate utilization protein